MYVLQLSDKSQYVTLKAACAQEGSGTSTPSCLELVRMLWKWIWVISSSLLLAGTQPIKFYILNFYFNLIYTGENNTGIFIIFSP